jgi:hypothetical protein
MPPRWLSLAIVVFWLGTTGWLFWHDLWPRYRPGNPPPFTIDLTEEVQNKERIIGWTVYQNGQKMFAATTWVHYDERDDSFSLYAKYVPVTRGRGLVRGLALKHFTSCDRVSREGDLLATEVHLELDTFDLDITGEVRDGVLRPRLRSMVLDVPEALQPSPVKLPTHGSMFQPLHPLNRIEGLRPGQTWRQPCFNPLADSFKALALFGGSRSGERYMSARVLPEPQTCTIQNRTKTCLVIEYTGADGNARTWVEQSSGLVLRQEADLEGDEWEMRRDQDVL